jgi:hypothetical protein
MHYLKPPEKETTKQTTKRNTDPMQTPKVKRHDPEGNKKEGGTLFGCSVSLSIMLNIEKLAADQKYADCERGDCGREKNRVDVLGVRLIDMLNGTDGRGARVAIC